MFLLWPFTGALITIVTRPKSWWKAARNGAVVAGIICLFMLLLIGWVPFAIASQVTTNDLMKTLATDVWHDAEASGGTLKTKEKLIEKYPVLADVPDAGKPNVLSNRAIADGVAMGPAIMLALFITTLFLGSPIIFGAVIAQLLLSRRQRWWIFAPRYVAAWFATFMTLGMIGAVIGGSDRNLLMICLLYTSPSPRDQRGSRMPSSA